MAIVVHPTRDIRRAIGYVRDWAGERGIEVVQTARADGAPQIAPEGTADGTRLVVAMGGDGTVLAALREAAPAGVPVLGVACGSLGALTTVPASDVPMALRCFEAGEWAAHEIPALAIEPQHDDGATAFNDLVFVRAGGNQVTASVEVDGDLYGRFSGDGVIVASQLGSSAYSMAAGGPVLAPSSDSWVITPLAPHGGSIPPLVLGGESTVRLTVEPGHGGARVEIDGRATDMRPGTFGISMRRHFATVVRVGEEEAFLHALRRRMIIMDSPRVLARDARAAAAARARPGPAPRDGA